MRLAALGVLVPVLLAGFATGVQASAAPAEGAAPVPVLTVHMAVVLHEAAAGVGPETHRSVALAVPEQPVTFATRISAPTTDTTLHLRPLQVSISVTYENADCGVLVRMGARLTSDEAGDGGQDEPGSLDQVRACLPDLAEAPALVIEQQDGELEVTTMVRLTTTPP